MKHSIHSLTKVVAAISAFTLAALVLLITYDAFMRYVFHSGSIALQELEWHFFDVVILLSIAYTLQQNAHVRVDIFYEKYSQKTKHIINLIALLFFVMPFSALIIYIAYDFVLLSFQQLEGSSNPGGLPYRFLVKSLMPLAFIFLILQSIAQVLDTLEELKK